jgi:hypothetical protein
MQSMSVLLLEMTYSCQGKKEENLGVMPSIKKLMRWLRAMQGKDAVAARAYAVVRDILDSSAPTFRTKVDELLELNKDFIAQP